MFCCFDIKNQTVSLDCSLLGLGERRGREGTGRGEEEGSDEPSALEGSLEAGGGHSGWGPAVGFARLAARLLLPHSFPSQVTGGRVVEAWADSESSGDSSTVAMNGRVDFP